MEEVLNRIAAETGLTQDKAKEAVGHILAYMKAEGTDPAVETMIAETPGANEAIAAAGGGGMLGSVMGAFGGGIMALGAKLMGLGLDMGQIRMIASELITYAKANAGDETVDRVIATTPGLAQFA
ncbi:MAG: DUF2267 domain-containing protein [Hyphomicrobiales bacterium]|nr:MAG: DUF2267 domain-containing protein [Hyphomicrobiales bacterium]